MTLRLRVHVDVNGNAVVPVGKDLRGQDVDLHVEVVEPGENPPETTAASLSLSTTPPFRQKVLEEFRSSNAAGLTPREFTEAELNDRLKAFDELTGAWKGEFVEPEDPPPEATSH